MNAELARQHAQIAAVRARIASRPKLEKTVPARCVRYVEPATPSSFDLPRPRVRYASPHYDHVRAWRRVERARRPRGPRVEDVVDAACEAWGVTRDEILNERGHRKEAMARRVVVAYLCRELVRGASLQDVGVRLCRDHTSVMHAYRVARRKLAAGDASVTAKVADVLRYLGLKV